MKILDGNSAVANMGHSELQQVRKHITRYVLLYILQLPHHTTHFRVDALHCMCRGRWYSLNAPQKHITYPFARSRSPHSYIVLPRAGRGHHSSFSRKGGHASKEQSAVFFKRSSNDWDTPT